jgi:DNA-binding CsgD family transcriptional regulator
MLDQVTEQAILACLTRQQQQVAILLGQGLTYAEVAERLYLSPHTVHEHLRHIYERLGCSRREQLVVLLMRAGLLK